MNLDAILVKKVAQLNNSSVGKFLSSLASKVGGASSASLLGAVFTVLLGSILTYPIYLAGGLLPALPTGIFTVILLLAFLIANLYYLFKASFGKKAIRVLLLLAILFSLPFGVLSLPLLHAISKK